MDIFSITTAWVSHLPSLFWKDPSQGNEWLMSLCQDDPALRPVPSIHPGLPHWIDEVDALAGSAAPAVRADPAQYGIAPTGPAMRDLTIAIGERQMILMLAVRLEDSRQRHPLDRAPELTSADVRTLIRLHPAARLVVTHADRAFIEEVHFGATPTEAQRILWDVSWIWGPPEDHLELLIETVGIERFTFGTGQPLRLADNAVAKLDLLGLSPERRMLLESGNVNRFTAAP